MPRDIRSYITIIPKGGKQSNDSSKKSTSANQFNEDEIADSPAAKILPKSKKRMRIIDDSDDEIFEQKAEKKSVESKKDKKSSQYKKLKGGAVIKTEVKAADIFGSQPIKRTPVLKPIKQKEENHAKNTSNEELVIHSDDDFQETLLALDSMLESKTDTKKSPKQAKSLKSPSKKTELPNVVKVITERPDVVNVNGDTPKNKPAQAKLNGSSPVKSFKKENNKIERSTLTPNKEGTSTDSNLSKFKVSPSKLNGNDHRDSSSKLKNESFQTKPSPYKSNEEKDKKGTLQSNAIEKFNHAISKKRPISEILDGDDSRIQSSANKNIKKQKKNDTLNESVLSDEDRFERRRHSAAAYQQYLNRSGPKNLGAKEIPTGKPNCLKGLAFVITGVLESFEREEIVEAIKQYGGEVKSGISKKVTHLLTGEEAGQAKLAKASELQLQVINEDGFLALIKGTSPKKHDKPMMTPKKQNKPITKKYNKQAKEEKCSPPAPFKSGAVPDSSPKVEEKDESIVMKKEIPDLLQPSIKVNTTGTTDAQMWVEKYKPKNLKQIIGQLGEASNVKKLMSWLSKWYINRKAKLSKPSPWAKNDDGGYFKAALLSGPPGVGKTTTVGLVCAELGFHMVEFNASDTRNKTLIKEQITEILTTNTLSGFAQGKSGKSAITKKNVLVMDEVDGMAGNEDRGGLQELISLIKISAVPIICMCNDRNHQKMRSLVNYCYDLRFNRPRVDQIKGAMMSICFKESLKIPSDVVTQIIVASNQDIRQTLNLLSMWSSSENLNKDDKTNSRKTKDIKLGPWDIARKVFSAEEHKTMSIHDKSDLFFHDYSLAPLFVQENYLHVVPHPTNASRIEVLRKMSMAADSLSIGDLVEAKIRGSGAWNLLPVQAMYSSVIPGHAMSGHMGGQIQFPAWLGKNSRASKMARLARDIHSHMKLSTSGSKGAVVLDYAHHLRDAIIQPLVRLKGEGVEQSLDMLHAYHLLREDLDSLSELALWPGQRDPMLLVDSKVKANMTRAYNKEGTTLPYAPAAIKKARSGQQEKTDYLSDEEDEENPQDASEESDVEADALVKKKKNTTTSSKQVAASSGTSNKKKSKKK